MNQQQNSNRITSSRHFKIALFATVIVFSVGIVWLTARATGFFVATESDAGTLATNAKVVSDSSASGGKAIEFTAAAAPDPTPPPPSGSTRPDATNSGLPAGTSLTTYTGSTWNSSENIVLDGYNFTSTSGYTFAGNNVTIRNSQFASSIITYGDNITIERSTIRGGLGLSGAAVANIRYNQFKEFTSDGIHVTSDTGQVSDVSLVGNYIHTPMPGCGAHADGLQVRGVNGLTLTNNNFDMGPWKLTCGLDSLNAAVYIETANGGNSNVTLDGNYLNGGGYILRLSNGVNHKFVNNRFGPDGYYGALYNAASSGTITQWSGNVMDANGQSVNP